MLLLLSQVKRESNRRATERYLENIHTLATFFRLFCKVYLCFPTGTRFGGFWFCVFAFLKCDYLHININGPVVFKALIRGYKLVALFYLVLLFDSRKVFLRQWESQSQYNLPNVRVCFTYLYHPAVLQKAFVLVFPEAWSGFLNSQVSELMHQYCSLPHLTPQPT